MIGYQPTPPPQQCENGIHYNIYFSSQWWRLRERLKPSERLRERTPPLGSSSLNGGWGLYGPYEPSGTLRDVRRGSYNISVVLYFTRCSRVVSGSEL